jgi:hypothetical protein
MSDHRISVPMPRFDGIDFAAYDEIALWSAPFGLKLLEVVALRSRKRAFN